MSRTGADGCSAHDGYETGREESFECPVVRTVCFVGFHRFCRIVDCAFQDGYMLKRFRCSRMREETKGRRTCRDGAFP